MARELFLWCNQSCEGDRENPSSQRVVYSIFSLLEIDLGEFPSSLYLSFSLSLSLSLSLFLSSLTDKGI